MKDFQDGQTPTLTLVIEVGDDESKLLLPSVLLHWILAEELEVSSSGQVPGVLVVIGDHNRPHIIHGVVDNGSLNLCIQNCS